MVTVVQGKLGAGKSYDCVRMAVEHLRAGGAVRSNIRIDAAGVARFYRRRLAPWQFGIVSESDDPATIPTGDRRGHGRRRVIVILDEALNWFESTAGKDDSRRATWGRWLRQSDKLGQDVFFIAQDFNRAAKWIRELAAQCVELVSCRGLSWLGIPWGRLPGLRNLYARRVWDVRSHDVVSWCFRRYSPEYWQFYDTAETFGFAGAANIYDAGVVFPAHRPIFLPPALAIASAAAAAALALWSV